MDKCIICNGKIISKCRCIRRDSTCEDGHTFHYSPVDKEYHLGISNHGSEECCQGKEKILHVEKENN